MPTVCPKVASRKSRLTSNRSRPSPNRKIPLNLKSSADTTQDASAAVGSPRQPKPQRTAGQLQLAKPKLSLKKLPSVLPAQDLPVETWPISRLHEHPLHDLHFPLQPAAELEVLLESLKAYGQREPLEVLPDGTVVSGRHRLIAAKQLGWGQLEVRVRHDLVSAGEAQIELFLIDCNSSRRQLSGFARARLYLRRCQLEEHGGKRRGQGELRDSLAGLFGMSGRNLDRYVHLLREPREVQDAVESGKLPLTDALKFSSLGNAKRQQVLELLSAEDKDYRLVRAILRPKNCRSKTSQGGRNALSRLIAAGKDVEKEIGHLSQSLSPRDKKQVEKLALLLVRLIKLRPDSGS